MASQEPNEKISDVINGAIAMIGTTDDTDDNVIERVQPKSEELSGKVKTVLDKWKEKRAKDEEMALKLKEKLETAVIRVTDRFHKQMTDSYKDKEIQERIKSLEQIIGEIQTIEEHFHKMEQKFQCVRSTVYKKWFTSSSDTPLNYHLLYYY